MDLDNLVALMIGDSSTPRHYDYAKCLLENGVKVALCCSVNNFERCQSAVNEYANAFGVGSVLALQCDVSNHNQFENAFKSCIGHFKRIDIVVNSASAFDDTTGDPETVSNTNYEGVVRGTILAIKYMGVPLGGRGGTVVQIVSRPTDDSMVPVYRSFRRNVAVYTTLIGTDSNPAHQRITFMTLCVDSSSENVGRHLVRILRLGRTGDCWIAENGKLAKLE